MNYGRKENEKGFYERVGKYWKEALNLNFDGRNKSWYWSAAFISYVMKISGVPKKDFKPSIRHSEYIHQALQNKKNKIAGAKFVGHRLTEYAPKIGDLVCFAAQPGIDYDSAVKLKKYRSHCDIVVFSGHGQVMTIGGNVEDSVSLRTFQTDTDGHLTDETKDWFVVIENKMPK